MSVNRFEKLDIVVFPSDKDWVGQGRTDVNKRTIIGKMLTFEAVEHGKPKSKAMTEAISKGGKLLEGVDNVFQGIKFLSAVEIKNNYQYAIVVKHKDIKEPLRLDLDVMTFSKLMQTCDLSGGNFGGTYSYAMLEGDRRKRLVGNKFIK